MQSIPAIQAMPIPLQGQIPPSRNWRAVYHEIALHGLDFRKLPPAADAKQTGVWTVEVRQNAAIVNLQATQQTDLWPANPEFRIEARCRADALGSLIDWTAEVKRTRRGPAYLDFEAKEQGRHHNGTLELQMGNGRSTREISTPLVPLLSLLARLPFLNAANLPGTAFTFFESFTLAHPGCRLRASKGGPGHDWLLTGVGLLPTEFHGQPSHVVRRVTFGRQRALVLAEIGELQP